MGLFGEGSAAAGDGEAEKVAMGAIEEFFVAWNKGDNAGIHEVINWPHAFLFGNGGVRISRSGAELMTDFEGMRRREGWDRSTLDSAVATVSRDWFRDSPHRRAARTSAASRVVCRVAQSAATRATRRPGVVVRR